MWTFIKTFFLFLVLLLKGNWHDAFTRHVIRGTKTRRDRKQAKGITEELDEKLSISDGFSEDTSFIAFTKTGYIASFRIHRQGKGRYEMSQLLLEVPGTGQFTALDTRTSHLGQGPLQLRMIDPMRRWKVSFRGPLQRSDGDGQTRPIHAYLSFYWECIADPFDHWSNVSCWQMAKNFSSNDLWTGVKAVLSCNHHTWYEQWGMMRGRLELDGLLEETVTFRTLRTRSVSLMARNGNTKEMKHFVVDDGRLHFTTGMLIDKGRSMRKLGSVTLPYGGRFASDQPDLNININGDVPTVQYPFSVNVVGRTYKIEHDVQKPAKLCWDIDGERGTLTFNTFQVNGLATFGVSVCTRGSIQEKTAADAESTPKLHLEPDVDLHKTVVSIESDEFCVPALVGGKGSQLATLHRLGKRVPKAICVTTVAFQQHIDAFGELKDKLDELQEEVQREKSELQNICSDAIRLCKNTNVRVELQKSINAHLQESFGKNEFDKKRFAVRSSGVGEDGSESSSAGQMETFLGVRGLEQILSAVLSCWASSLTYQVVEYRRQNGQRPVDPMAVVIQEMVEADVAGVLFTNDPVSGSSTVMVINASPGLGEAVVSGESTPDTFKVRRGHNEQDFEVIETTVGSKSVKITMSDTDGVRRVVKEDNTLCLSEQQVLEICRVGLELESKLGCPQDVEWAISSEVLYILQTRPVTTLDMETDDELVREFDSPVGMDTEFVTTCNIREMAPGAFSTLTVDNFIRCLSDSSAWVISCSGGVKYPEYANKTIQSFSNQGFLNMTAMTMPMLHSLSSRKEMIEIFLLGEVVHKHTLETLKLYRASGKSLLSVLKCNIHSRFFRSPGQLKKFDQLLKEVDQFTIGDNARNAVDQYTDIDKKRGILQVTWRANSYKTNQSTLWTGFLMAILKGKKVELSVDNNADLALLLSNCKNVHSADVPTATQTLARDIVESGNKETFMSLSDNECHTFMMNTESPLRTKYKEFLKRHGHRCVKEVEFLVKSWTADPSVLMHSLKLLIKTEAYKAQEKKQLSPKEVVSMLKTPVSRLKRFLMEKWLINKARNGVGQRELGKSFTVKTQNMIKLAYWRLAEMMVLESRLPEEKLLFFLTHNEIGELLETRSPLLIRKAKRRMKVFALQDSIRFPKYNFGVPVALTTTQQTRAVGGPSVTVTGMAVGRGQAEGRACIIQRLADADNIQHGDILICPYTDIGWTPYFSMIAGLVTEMGGLLSHGSVVAREVGIPCVVNVADVTSIFVTGDYVRIDGAKGTVTKIERTSTS